jgi:hypothetical protein
MCNDDMMKQRCSCGFYPQPLCAAAQVSTRLRCVFRRSWTRRRAHRVDSRRSHGRALVAQLGRTRGSTLVNMRRASKVGTGRAVVSCVCMAWLALCALGCRSNTRSASEHGITETDAGAPDLSDCPAQAYETKVVFDRFIHAGCYCIAPSVGCAFDDHGGFTSFNCVDSHWQQDVKASCKVDEKTCYSPTQNLETSTDPNAQGCLCDVTHSEGICILQDEQRDTADNISALIAMVCSDGVWHWVNDGPCQGYGDSCFSPQQNLDSALERTGIGCYCDMHADAPACATDSLGRHVSLGCNLRWWAAKVDSCPDE